MLVAAGPRAISKISLAVVPLWYGLLIALAIRACIDGQPLVGDTTAASLEYETIDYGSCPGAETSGIFHYLSENYISIFKSSI